MAHQEIVSRRLIRTWPYSYLLCDEVGLVKTIGAGLAIRSLYLSGLVRRVLVAPPASLTVQWQREVATKFFLPFARVKGGSVIRHEYLFPDEATETASGMYDPDLCISSTGLMSCKERLELIDKARPFDIALVDEAHYARRKNPHDGERSTPQYGNLYKTIRDRLIKRCKSLWLATATPMQLDWIEVFDLIRLTRRVAHFQEDPTLTWGYYRALGKLIHDREPDQNEWDLLRQSISTVKWYDPMLWRFFQDSIIDTRTRSAASQWLENKRIPRGIDRRYIRRLIFAAAPLSRVMLRHTRSLLEIYRENGRLGANLARREIQPIRKITLNGLEKEAYDALEAYCRELTRKIGSNAKGAGWKASVGFYLSFLRLRLASSTFAIRETIRRRKQRVIETRKYLHREAALEADPDTHDSVYGDSEDTDDAVIENLLKNRTKEDLLWEEKRLGQMLEQLADLSAMPLKMKELLTVLEQRRCGNRSRVEQTVIFTRFYDTLLDIVDRLRRIEPAMRIGTYSGKGGQYVDVLNNRLRSVDRDDIGRRFIRGEIDVLICTDAAAEGLNLQTASLIINYDLPWNPMKVEQRIGRIDRIGQSHAVIHVLNLCYVGSAEQIVYDRLLTRLAQAGTVVGAQQISMLPVTEDEFAALAEGSLKEEDLFSTAKKRIEIQKERTESLEVPARDLYEIYLRIKEQEDQTPPPVTLDDLWDAMTSSKYLMDLGAVLSSGYPMMKVPPFGEIAGDCFVTADRSLYQNGAPDIEQPIHFASYGDPVFDRILESFAEWDLPECVVRIEESVPDTDARVVGYVVACLNNQGNPEDRMVIRYSELADITPDESRRPSEVAVSEARIKLHRIVREEFDPTRRIPDLIEENQQAGQSQDILNLLVADSLFPGISYSRQDNFWQSVKSMDELIAKRDQLIVPEIPSDALDAIHKNLLFVTAQLTASSQPDPGMS